MREYFGEKGLGRPGTEKVKVKGKETIIIIMCCTVALLATVWSGHVQALGHSD